MNTNYVEYKNPSPDFPESAFPIEGGRGLGSTTGMSLRDYFAAKAMEAIIAKAPFSDSCEEDIDDTYYLAVAEGAYAYADSMLQARQE